MAPRHVNVLLSSYRGLGLPSTFNLVCPETLSFRILLEDIYAVLPLFDSRLIVTTVSSKEISSCDTHISTLLHGENADFVQLRLSTPLLGGKGGFGSQLRAAGGRMSSKRKKNQGENNGSNRNLDGRRLRTVNEAKALAEYLALKPDMEKKEKEARRKRWEEVVNLAEQKQEELRTGAKGKIDGQWSDDKDEVGVRTREAVFSTMKLGDYRDNLKYSSKSPGQPSSGSDQDEQEDVALSMQASSSKASSLPRSYFGFEEDDEFMSESDLEDRDFCNKG